MPTKPYKVVSASVDLERGYAQVAFGTGKFDSPVKVHVAKFNPPGELGESELRALAVDRAKGILRAVIAADPQ